MFTKLILCIAFLALGIFLIYDGAHTLHPIEPHKTTWEKTKEFFTDNPMWNPLIKCFGGTPVPEKQPPTYTTFGSVKIAAGSVLTLAGLLFAYLWYRRKN